MTKQESTREIIIPRLKESLERYKQREGDYLTDNAIEIIHGMINDFEKTGSLRPSQRAFALDLIKNSFPNRNGRN